MHIGAYGMIKAMDDPAKSIVQFMNLRGRTALFIGAAAGLSSVVALRFSELQARVAQATTPKTAINPDIVVIDSALFVRQTGLDAARLQAMCRDMLEVVADRAGALIIIAPPELILSSTDTQTRQAATEAALRALVRVLRFEYGAKGWKISLVVPGHVRLPGQPVISRSPVRADMVRRWQTAPIHRLIEADDVARLVAFLASDASSYANGANVSLAHDA